MHLASRAPSIHRTDRRPRASSSPTFHKCPFHLRISHFLLRQTAYYTNQLISQANSKSLSHKKTFLAFYSTRKLHTDENECHGDHKSEEVSSQGLVVFPIALCEELQSFEDVVLAQGLMGKKRRHLSFLSMHSHFL